jgi:hypothetical protein
MIDAKTLIGDESDGTPTHSHGLPAEFLVREVES